MNIFFDMGKYNNEYKREVMILKNSGPNKSIKCTVSECKHKCTSEDYCSLEHISVATHEADPSVCECVYCRSFTKK